MPHRKSSRWCHRPLLREMGGSCALAPSRSQLGPARDLSRARIGADEGDGGSDSVSSLHFISWMRALPAGALRGVEGRGRGLPDLRMKGRMICLSKELKKIKMKPLKRKPEEELTLEVWLWRSRCGGEDGWMGSEVHARCCIGLPCCLESAHLARQEASREEEPLHQAA